MTHKTIQADRLHFVAPPFAVIDTLKRDVIAESMRVDGWLGRPLLLTVWGDGLRALTGTHRLAAAEAADIDVPVVIVDDEDLTAEQWDELDLASRDDDLVIVLSDCGLDEAVALMQAEIDADNL